MDKIKEKGESLTFKDIKSLITDYISGKSKSALAKKYGIAYSSVEKYINDHPTTRAEIEKIQYDIQIARENAAIVQLKEKFLNFINIALDEAESAENKMYYFSKIKDVLGEIDKIFRLNLNKATDINKNINENRNYDVAEILKTLKTPEEQQEYLLSKLQNYDKDNSNSGG